MPLFHYRDAVSRHVHYGFLTCEDASDKPLTCDVGGCGHQVVKIDALEVVVSAEHWPVPGYNDILFYA